MFIYSGYKQLTTLLNNIAHYYYIKCLTMYDTHDTYKEKQNVDPSFVQLTTTLILNLSDHPYLTNFKK